jgi:hypothetical protein
MNDVKVEWKPEFMCRQSPYGVDNFEWREIVYSYPEFADAYWKYSQSYPGELSPFRLKLAGVRKNMLCVNSWNAAFELTVHYNPLPFGCVSITGGAKIVAVSEGLNNVCVAFSYTTPSGSLDGTFLAWFNFGDGHCLEWPALRLQMITKDIR